MKLRAQTPPHIRSREGNATLMGDCIIAMLPLYMMATYFYGGRAIVLGLVGILFATVTDGLCVLLSYRVPNLRDLSAVVTGMMIPLLLPASVRVEIIAASAVFAIAVVKHPFGGTGHNIFNPAAAGVAFATVCWPTQVFAYPPVFSSLPLQIGEHLILASSPAKALALGGAPRVDWLDLLLGNCAGAMGATHILVLGTCLLYLIFRKLATWQNTLSFLAGAALVAGLFPRAPISPLRSIGYEWMSGLLLFGAVFLINDPVTTPKRQLPRMLYGFLTGALGMIFRHYGYFEESLLFAILIMNASVWMIDLWGEGLAHQSRRKHHAAQTISPVSEETSSDLGNTAE